ncbi:SWR1-complex protein 4 [Fulvia fulva]|uniref:SWR1-complex protein 4 n=1 Tax=Passalora fulva TaxID=5499 RepID=A0A9Q8PKT5_PASFU|nr:SWR1-complex protein 4 [Fulvia fulva]KAK4610624.1 SWR1-complex protein 4 [Fulvia fulva]KAK4611040.1 SWR1-complex protein 4 [Fulvia fulva]UJO24260.1 SWR1-complex protein 4 [Fulvia fulva]WPV22244.1 SWR1-complex protein 4 [Fulvia fulva]WPV36901.1 SWR1-complex protein 4 [Fulvia fulva]
MAISRPRRAARWAQTPATERRDLAHVQRWERAKRDESHPSRSFAPYNVGVDVPQYDADVYEKHLISEGWTKEETDYLVETYRECNGKWPVVADHYAYEGSERSMEDMKARYYTISAALLALATPISSMTAADYTQYETLSNFKPEQETSRKRLAEGHLYRRANEVDEESVLLGELQRIMLNQATLDSQREDLRKRLDHPSPNTNSYQYNTSQALTGLWQQLLAQDRLKKNPRLRPTGNPAYDGLPGTAPISARPRDSLTAQASDPNTLPARRPTRDSLPSATPQSALPTDLSKSDMSRFGVIHTTDKLPSGISFASDKLSKPRIAKSTIQTEKIAAILQNVGVQDLIPLPTGSVIEVFEGIMGKVQTLLDMRKLAEKEEQEIKIRDAEKA